jgi:hypothetical protein
MSKLKYNGWNMVSFSHRHDNGINPYDILSIYQDDNGTPIPHEESLASKLKHGRAFFLSVYAKSAFTDWTLIDERNNTCQFDSVRVAGIAIFDEPAKELPTGYKARQELMRKELLRYNDYRNGYNRDF